MEEPQDQAPVALDVQGTDGLSRFSVNKVDGSAPVADSEDVENGLGGDGDDISEQSLSQFTYTYDTRYAKSMGQLTREALPRAENYRDLMSSFNYNRPTLDELHEGQFKEKVRCALSCIA
jgi:solute carrier family 12 sodium/potassium/chloride transporter 2